MPSSRPSTSTPAGMGSSKKCNSTGGSGHAVDRSSEFLACARSALQMGQEKHRRLVQRQAENGGAVPIMSASDEDDGSPNLPEELLSMAPSKLQLYSSAPAASRDIYASAGPSIDEDAPLTTDALRLLSALDSNTATLSSLVRRRGHTNDPTARINETVGQFDEMAKELLEMVEQIKAEGTLPMEFGSAGGGRKRMSQQRARHYEYVAKDLSAMADARVTKFKKMLEVREKVIRDQNERRRMLNPTTAASTKRRGAGSAAAGASSSSASSVANSGSIAATITAKSTLIAGAKGGASQLSSPLFTVGAGSASAVRPPPPPARPANGAHASASVAARRTQAAPNGLHQSSAPPSMSSAGNGAYGGANGSYGAYGGGGGYGGVGGSGYGGMGMRRRPNAPGMPPSSASAAGNGYAGYGGQSYQYGQQQQPYNPAYGDDDSKKTDGDDAAAVQNSIQTRRARRETAARLEQARNAERTLANLGTMFSKMADLVVAQGETIEKVEDDVEAARVDVYAGHEEIQKLYGITKGNRGLILKVFGILIFFIIFMRFY